EAEQHDPENEPWSASSDGAFGDSTGVEGRRGKVAEDNRRPAPKRNERQRDCTCDHNPGRRRSLFGRQEEISPACQKPQTRCGVAPQCHIRHWGGGDVKRRGPNCPVPKRTNPALG